MTLSLFMTAIVSDTTATIRQTSYFLVKCNLHLIRCRIKINWRCEFDEHCLNMPASANGQIYNEKPDQNPKRLSLNAWIAGTQNSHDTVMSVGGISVAC